jgi:hypothetical protein
MKEDVLAKGLLSGEIQNEYLWIWELSDDGYIIPEDEHKLLEYAKANDINMRIIRPKTMITMDLRMNRLNINLDENNKIKEVDRG